MLLSSSWTDVFDLVKGGLLTESRFDNFDGVVNNEDPVAVVWDFCKFGRFMGSRFKGTWPKSMRQELIWIKVLEKK